MGRMIEFEVTMRPNAAMAVEKVRDLPPPETVGGALRLNPYNAGAGALDFRVTKLVHEDVRADLWMWAVVERWPSGHEEILLGSHAPSALEATVQGLPHYERISAERRKG